MNLLLDTHTFIWATALPSRLSQKVSSLLSNSSNRLRLSAASVWEISLKHSLQRRDFYFPEDLVVRGVKSLACEILPIEARHVLRSFACLLSIVIRSTGFLSPRHGPTASSS